MNQDTPSDRDKAGQPAGEDHASEPLPATEDNSPADALTADGPDPADPQETTATPDLADRDPHAALVPDEPAADSPAVGDAAAVIERTVEVRKGGGLAAFALLIALAGVAGSAFLWWQQSGGAKTDPGAADTARYTELSREVDALQGRVAELETTARDSGPPPAAADAALNEAVAANRDAGTRLERSLAAVAQRLDALESAPGSSPTPLITTGSAATLPPGPGWKRAEIELLLRVAHRQMALARDPASAREALAEADRAIEALDDPSLLPVRRQIADDLLALRSVAVPDIDGISFRLASSQARVASLAVKEGAAREEETPGAQDPADEGLARLERKSKEFIGGLVRVRDSTSDDRVFRTPSEVWFLRRNLELELQAARVALLTGNPGAYRESLRKAARWTEVYFDPADAGVQAFVESLAELEARQVEVEYPDVSGSLRVYLETAAPAPTDG